MINLNGLTVTVRHTPDGCGGKQVLIGDWVAVDIHYCYPIMGNSDREILADVIAQIVRGDLKVVEDAAINSTTKQLREENEKQRGQMDMYRDEFMRILAICDDVTIEGADCLHEIRGICERAKSDLSRRVPLTVENEQLQAKVASLQEENERLKAKFAKLVRIIDVADELNQSMTEQEVAASASFKEAVAHAENDRLEEAYQSLLTDARRMEEALERCHEDINGLGIIRGGTIARTREALSLFRSKYPQQLKEES